MPQNIKKNPYDLQHQFELAVNNGLFSADITSKISEQKLDDNISGDIGNLIKQYQMLCDICKQQHDYIADLERLVDYETILEDGRLIPGRAAYLNRVDWAISMKKRYGYPSCSAVWQIDNYDTLYDESSSESLASNIIKDISGLILTNLRESDFVAKIEDNKYAALLYYSSEFDGYHKSNYIANIVTNEIAKKYEGASISISSAAYSIAEKDDPDSAIKKLIDNLDKSFEDDLNHIYQNGVWI